ncbi:MAG: quinoprotein dehydrogenase-associated SoxYZ-like carrier [Pseudomonadota bacterium]
MIVRIPGAVAVTWIAAAASVSAVAPALAGKTWDDLKPEVFGATPIESGVGIVTLKAPTRPDDQRKVPIAIEAELPDGRTIKSLTVIVDENPSPVAARFHLGPNRRQVSIAARFRLNSETDVRAVVEASDGALYMVESHVRFAGGQASCSAPPQGDPKEIAETMGQMTLTHERSKVAASQLHPKARLDVRHPNHTGLVLDQLTLLYTPLRIVERLEVRQGDERVLDMEGSMTVSQDPSIDFDYEVNGAEEMKVRLQDSDGAVWQNAFPLGNGS